MTLTATRNEDVGFMAGLFAAKPKAVDTVALVNTALAGFQTAADNLATAKGIIAAQKTLHQEELEAAQKKVTECEEQDGRLDRIHERLAEFLS